jgi:transcriptional regulator with XRE-family HTH domain
MQDISLRAVALLLQRGWSQQQLAELSGLISHTIQPIENGQPVRAESFRSLVAVCEIAFTTLSSEPVMSPATFEFIPFFGAEWECKQVEKQLGRAL